jgi:hypothetical protein
VSTEVQNSSASIAQADELSEAELRIRGELSDPAASWPPTATQLGHAQTVQGRYGKLTDRFLPREVLG